MNRRVKQGLTEQVLKQGACEMRNISKSVDMIDSIGDDLLGNILNRLPAVAFASSACVNRSWNRLCTSLLSTPKLASALSLNPSIQDALEEVFSKVLAEPIRPHFAIVYAPSYELLEARKLVTKRLGSAIPIICATVPYGLMGRDAVTDSFKEFQWREYFDPDKHGAVLVTVGFLPGLKVSAIASSSSKKEVPFEDEFVTDIRECSAALSGYPSPVAIMLFAGGLTDTNRLVEKLDNAMSSETIIVGDGRVLFLGGGNCIEKDSERKDLHFEAGGAALLFMRDPAKPHGIGTIQFHVALSTGMSPIGPTYKAISVKENSGEGTTWLTARREGFDENLDGQTILNQFFDEVTDRIEFPDIHIGVVKRRKCSLGSGEVRWITSQVFHVVCGGDAYLHVEGSGIKTGDFFHIFLSDSHLADSSLENVRDTFKSLKQCSGGSSNCLRPSPGDNNKIFGGIIFANFGRDTTSFGKSNVNCTPFLENFPGVTLAGSFCGKEICRGDSSSYDPQDCGSYRCCVHSYSSVFLVMSYTPPGPGI